MASVRVAVRLRPFNTREVDMAAKLCIEMEGQSTKIWHPETKKDNTFAFDFSYWSHDGFKTGPDGELIPLTPKYATQRQVYDDLGADVLKAAFEGYNSTLFAYGQTGAGKSFSMVGYGVNKGIIPICCNEMFNQIKGAKEGESFEVVVTMLEIYNEVIKDLLNPAATPKGGLKVRTKPGIGVYVEGLTPVPVQNYAAVEKQMDVGTTNRTVASTKMNATSSRAHTVFGIQFVCNKSIEGEKSQTASSVNLVDLAGSERAESTGATGDRLKEGSAINQSLSALGNVISALAEIAGGKKKVFVPYRNSALTRLLQDALGGNSRTIMICALSPADVNYDETLGTLRYADRAKRIKNKVVKNENPTDRIIRLLNEENARLKALLEGKGISVPLTGPDGEPLEGSEGGGGGGGGSAEENKLKFEEQMRENERILAEMNKSWEQKLEEAKRLASSQNSAADTGAVSMNSIRGTTTPFITNLHEDLQLSECVVYLFKAGVTKIGQRGVEPKNDVVLSGLNVAKQHAQVTNDGGKLMLTNLNKSKTFHNGVLVQDSVELKHGDRLIFGNTHFYRVAIPEQEAKLSEEEQAKARCVWQFAMDEFTEAQGLRLDMSQSKAAAAEAENKARLEMESKLKAMEDEMAKQREEAKQMLELSRKALQGKGALTDEEKQQLRKLENAYNKASENVEEKMASRRALAEKMMQEQMGRQRATQKLEEELAALMPTINEANLMAEELGKPVKFEARLAVKSSNVSIGTVEELKNLKQIEINIRVTNTKNGNLWNWTPTKFENRLFIMRELYQEFLDYGPRDVPPSKDPFWDPPEAFEIGKAYVYLKALSQLVEIENEFGIVDYKGDEQGKLSVEIFPESPVEGAEPPDYLNDSKELIGKDVNFRVRIPYATGIPDKYSNQVYATFSFLDQPMETPSCEAKTTNPKWKFEHIFKVENITEAIANYLLKDAAVFEVKGFSDAQIEQMKAEEKGISAPAVAEVKSEAAAPAAHTPANLAGKVICEQCEEKEAEFQCLECNKNFDAGCFDLLHKSPKKAGHTKKPLPAQTSGAGKCEQCEEKAPTVQCVECEKALCDGCNTLLHKSAKKADHQRKPYGGAASAGGNCEQCEEQAPTVSCAECAKKLCEGCNNLLHKSAKKADHQRTPL